MDFGKVKSQVEQRRVGQGVANCHATTMVALILPAQGPDFFLISVAPEPQLFCRYVFTPHHLDFVGQDR